MFFPLCAYTIDAIVVFWLLYTRVFLFVGDQQWRVGLETIALRVANRFERILDAIQCRANDRRHALGLLDRTTQLPSVNEQTNETSERNEQKAQT